jgi:carbonic anhydrase
MTETPTNASDPAVPQRRITVVTCMDCRYDPLPLLGLAQRDAHVLRNAGGVITDDVLRSLMISQRMIGTRATAVIHHTDCGMIRLKPADFLDSLQVELGSIPPWDLGSFDDPYSEALESLRRIRSCEFLPHRDDVRTYVFDVKLRQLTEVTPSGRLDVEISGDVR